MADPSTPPEVAAVLARFAEVLRGDAASLSWPEAVDRVFAALDLIATIEREYREREAAEELAWAWGRLAVVHRDLKGPYVDLSGTLANSLLALADEHFARARRLLGIDEGE